MTNRIYGYARVSTMKQSIERQIDNIKSAYPDAVIITESYTGTKMDRPNWNKLVKQLHEGDVVVFDELSRMSRNAEEGFAAYRELYDKGINLIFLKESTLNTDNFRDAMERQYAEINTGSAETDFLANGMLKLFEQYNMMVVEKQIRTAFETSQHEVEFLHKRTSEGVRKAQAAGKQIGIEKGRKLTTKKSIAKKEEIRKYSKDFSGSLNDIEVMKITGLARNTYYKYKAEMKSEM